MDRRTRCIYAGIVLIGFHGLLKSAAPYVVVPRIAQTADGVRLLIFAIAEAL
ncbi:hypothetical protein [Paenibacillus lutrae]|uniref:hypothetical protein n=1 Tax=Paenibacillus lutrae TaxID=2078573 RepID=UPI001F2AAAE4|nr:hypothetical protein [Paenibacillus lutrae]